MNKIIKNINDYIDKPNIQGAIVGIVGALLNRFGIIFGKIYLLSSFQTTLLIEIILPFVCTFLICTMLRQKLFNSFTTASFASFVGAITTFSTIFFD